MSRKTDTTNKKANHSLVRENTTSIEKNVLNYS